MHAIFKIGVILLSLMIIQGTISAQPTLVLETFAEALDVPVGIVNAGDDRLFVVEKRGTIQIVDTSGSLYSQPFLDIRNLVNDGANERGLLGLVFHPDYAENGYFFVNYSNNSGDTQISRFSRSSDDPDLADPASEKKVLTVDQPRSNHNAGDLAFGPDGFLYIGFGDGGGAGDPDNYSQNTQSLLGKMLRIDINTDENTPYKVPENNPFVNDENVPDEIWAIGLRNPWRYSFDPLTGDLWIADVGQNAKEEVIFQPANSTGGENYGWRCYEGTSAYRTNNCVPEAQLTPPIHDYGHASANCGGSITGGYVYRGTTYPDLVGHYVYADYCTGKIYSLSPDGEGGWTNIELEDWTNNQIVSFGVDFKGELYMVAIGREKIYKVGTTVTSQNGELLGLKEVKISPNPFRDILHISGKSNARGDFEIYVYDTKGRIVFKREEPFADVFSKDYSLNGLAPGVYYLQIKKGENSTAWKVMKQ